MSNSTNAVPVEKNKFEDDGFRYFKPASYLIVEMNERSYNQIDAKYDLTTIIHKIALVIDKAVESGHRHVEVVFARPYHQYLTMKSNVEVVANIEWDDQCKLIDHVVRQLAAAGGYRTSVTRVDESLNDATRLAINW